VKDFVRTTGGRLVALAVAVALIAGGAAALLHEPSATWVVALAFPVAVALGFVGVAYASLDHWDVAVGLALSLPWVLFLYVIGVGLAVSLAPVVGYVLAVLGAGALAFALRPAERLIATKRENAAALDTAHAPGR